MIQPVPFNLWESSFAQFLESVPDAMIVTGEDGKILLANSQAEKLFGYQKQELIGLVIERLMPERFRTRHIHHRADYSANPHTRPMGVNLDLYTLRKDGIELPVEISLSPLKTPEGMVVVAAIRDITERKRILQEREKAQEALKKAHAELEQKILERTAQLQSANQTLQQEMQERRRLEKEVLGITEKVQQRIGHDLHDNLGQQLTAVTYLVRLLEKELTPKNKEHAQQASEILHLVSTAIDQVRFLSKGLYPVEVSRHGLVPALQELALSTEKNYRISCSVQSHPVQGYNNDTAIQLYRIAQEAVNNAVKHAQPKNIMIYFGQDGSTIFLSVQDDGVGITKTSTKPPGLGLHIMQYRAGLIGAELEISPVPNGGTMVRCLFKNPL